MHEDRAAPANPATRRVDGHPAVARGEPPGGSHERVASPSPVQIGRVPCSIVPGQANPGHRPESKIGKTLSPRMMRRTFHDLGRAAEVHDFVVRAISGHATATMHRRYSRVSDAEKRGGLAKVTALAGITAKVVIPVVIEGDRAGDTATQK